MAAFGLVCPLETTEQGQQTCPPKRLSRDLQHRSARQFARSRPGAMRTAAEPESAVGPVGEVPQVFPCLVVDLTKTGTTQQQQLWCTCTLSYHHMIPYPYRNGGRGVDSNYEALPSLKTGTSTTHLCVRCRHLAWLGGLLAANKHTCIRTRP